MRQALCRFAASFAMLAAAAAPGWRATPRFRTAAPADLARAARPVAVQRGGADLLEPGPPAARPAGAASGPRAVARRRRSCGNMARLRTHSHVLPVRGQRDLSQRMHRQSLEFRKAAKNIAMDKVYGLLGRPISVKYDGCRFVYDDTKEAVPIHTYASLARRGRRALARLAEAPVLAALEELPAARGRGRGWTRRGRPAATSISCRISRTDALR